MTKKFEIRNSTAEFLTFIIDGKEDGIQVLYKDETIWATQKAMAEFEKYRTIQDRSFSSDFDRFISDIPLLPDSTTMN